MRVRMLNIKVSPSGLIFSERYFWRESTSYIFNPVIHQEDLKSLNTLLRKDLVYETIRFNYNTIDLKSLSVVAHNQNRAKIKFQFERQNVRSVSVFNSRVRFLRMLISNLLNNPSVKKISKDIDLSIFFFSLGLFTRLEINIRSNLTIELKHFGHFVARMQTQFLPCSRCVRRLTGFLVLGFVVIVRFFKKKLWGSKNKKFEISQAVSLGP